MTREILPDRRSHITHKVKVGPTRTLYLSVDQVPMNEIWLRTRGDADAEKVMLYDVIARLISLAVKEGVPVEDIGSMLDGTKDATGGVVVGDDKIKMAAGTVDYIGRHILIYHAGRADLEHGKDD